MTIRKKVLVTAMAMGLIVVCGTLNEANAILLSRIQVGFTGFGPGGTFSGVGEIRDNASFSLEIEPSNAVGVGNWIVGPLTEGDIGTTFVASAATVSDYFLLEFDVIADLLTNGDPGDIGTGDLMLFGLGAFPTGGGGFGLEEHFVFFDNSVFGVPPGNPTVETEVFVVTNNDIDLEGYTIESISMQIDDLAILHVDGRTFYRGAYTLDIFGTGTPIPEPSTLLLLASGLAGLGLFRRRTS